MLSFLVYLSLCNTFMELFLKTPKTLVIVERLKEPERACQLGLIQKQHGCLRNGRGNPQGGRQIILSYTSI